MAINDSAVVPLYQQVKDDIRAAIESGKYKTNEKIPPEPELSAEYSVSRITVRRAVEELCAEAVSYTHLAALKAFPLFKIDHWNLLAPFHARVSAF